MFNFGNVIKAAFAVAAVVTNVVNTVIQRATGGQGRFAEAAQAFTNTVNSFFDGGEGSSRRDDDDQSGQATRPSGPSPEELRHREQERKAKAFDDDIDQQRSRDELQDDSDLEGVSSERRATLRLDIAAFLQGEPTPAELQLAAVGNPVAQALLQMMRHERSHLDQFMQAAQTVEQGIVSLFGLAEEDTFETAEAARIYEQSKAYSTDENLHLPLRLMTPEQIDELMADDAPLTLGLANDPETSNFFQTETTPFNDPCSESSDARQCYVEQLARFGVSLINDQDLAQTEELSGITLLEFSDEQLAVVLQGVQQTAERVALTINDIPMIADRPGQWLTPEEAFISTFGSIKFGYDPDHPLYLDSGRTIAPNDPIARTNPNNPIFITLDDKSFSNEGGGAVGFDVLPDDFVVVHELGHAFHRRYGGSEFGVERIAGTDYVNATGGAWFLREEITTSPQLPGVKPFPPVEVNGEHQTDDQGNPLYRIFPGVYSPGEYDLIRDSGFFPNEIREEGPHPSEGFADTFANFILNPDVIPPRHRSYFDDNMAYWLYKLSSRRR